MADSLELAFETLFVLHPLVLQFSLVLLFDRQSDYFIYGLGCTLIVACQFLDHNSIFARCFRCKDGSNVEDKD